MGKWLLTILFLLGSALLTHFVPFSSFFRNINTMIHEFWHALATLLLSGRVHVIYLFADHSGVTLSELAAGWRMIPVALAGYMGASLFAMAMFRGYHKGQQNLWLVLLTLICALSLVLFIRNPFGVIWSIGFMACNLLAIAFIGGLLRDIYYLFIAFLSLEQSVFGAISLLIVALEKPMEAGDAAVLSDFTMIPPVVWSGWFLLFSLWCAKEAIRYFLLGPVRR